jgi:hypothetical protein
LRTKNSGKVLLLALTATLMLLALCISQVSAMMVADGGSASIWTDKEDYSPEQTVAIFGAGFVPNAQIIVSVTRPNGWIDNWYIFSDSDGGLDTSSTA